MRPAASGRGYGPSEVADGRAAAFAQYAAGVAESGADFDIAILGSGSGNSLVTPDLQGKRIALVEGGVFGGTCLNVGCIPTKMYVYAADIARAVTDSAHFGIDAELDQVRWTDIRDRIFGRIDPISAGGRAYRQDSPDVTLYEGLAAFTSPHSISVTEGSQVSEFTADQIVIATGAHPLVPAVIADSGVPYHTSDTVMRIEKLPQRMVILGGGYISAEFAHVFSSLGVAVTVVARGDRLLRHLDEEISAAFTAQAGRQWDLRLSRTVERASGVAGDIRLRLVGMSANGGTEEIETDLLLVATGRRPNTDRLNLAEVGIATHQDGRVVVDEYGRTSQLGVWSLGDASSDYQLKHVANHEARAVAHNLAHPEQLRAFDHRHVPAAVFSHPQIATAGLTEEQAQVQHRNYVTATQSYGDTAYGWAMEDTVGICKLVADPDTGLLLGAHLMGKDASNLIQPLIQALTFSQRVVDVARGQYWIHPALMEVVENALLKLEFS